jgi:cytochrome c556
MKTWIKSTLAAGLAIAVLGAGVTTTQPAFADGHKKAGEMMHDKMGKKGVVKARVANFRAISKAHKAMKKAGKAGNAKAVAAAANEIASRAGKITGLFPKSTSRAKLSKKATRAKAAIWKDWPKFVAAAGNLKNAAVAVAAAAKAGDAKAGAKGIGKTCGGCHKPFRGKKAKKS